MHEDLPTHSAIDTVWRTQAPRIIASLARMLRDVGLAEELAQDALVTALERWPRDGVPDNPAAWLMTTAKRRALDRLRQHKLQQRKHALIVPEGGHDPMAAPDRDDRLDDDIGDDLLRLVFAACHPVLSTDAQVALTLRLLGGLSTGEIARAFLVPEPTIAQRIVRAKRALADHQVPFAVPRKPELAARLEAVLGVIYLIFNEGYTASSGDDWMRPTLCAEALRLGRVLATLLPHEPEVHALLALMEIQASRTAARLGPDGEPVLLLEQDRAQWDRLLVRRGLQALERATRLGGGGAYALQAAIAACHARARTAADTDWQRIAALYARLARITHSPVVELNRAVAMAMAFGPSAGLAHADTLAQEPSLARYHLLPTVRGDLLEKLGRHDEARAEFQRAAGLTGNARERALLHARAAACNADAGNTPAGS